MYNLKRVLALLIFLYILVFCPFYIKAQDINNITVNSFQEYLSVINKAKESLQPVIKLLINNFNPNDYSADNLKLDGIRNIKFKGTTYNNIAEITTEITYRQEYKIRQSKKNKLAQKRLDSQDKIVINEANKIINSIIKPNMTDYEKELAIHNYIILNSEYDYLNYLNGTIPYESYTIYGLLINRRGVCQAYSETTKLLLNMVGIECEIVSGVANSDSHEWNMVKLDDEYYMLDVTWDDPYPDEKGNISYTYFNITDKELDKTHKWNKSKWPKASGTYYNYYKYNQKNKWSLQGSNL